MITNKMITNKMNKIIQYLKMLPVLLVDYIKFLYRFMTLTFFITILSLIFDYIHLPAAAKPYFTFVFIIIYLILYSCKIHGYKVPLINSITKLVSYIIIVIPFAFVCLYLLDISIIETIYCEDSDTENVDIEEKSEDKKGKRLTRKTSSEIPTTLSGQAYSLISKGMETVNNVTSLGHKSVDAIREVGIKGLEVVDKSIDSIGENVKENIGEGAPVVAGLGVGKQIIKTFAHKGPVTSVAAGVVGTGLTVLAVGSATALYKGLSQNDKINTQLEEVKNSKLEHEQLPITESESKSKDVLMTGSVSPSETGGFIIPSPFENEIPLVTVLENILMLNILELGYISSIMFIILRGYLNPKLKILILKLLNYTLKNKDELFNKEEKINNIFENLAKHSHYAIVFLMTLLIVLKVTTVYFMFNLTEDIDSFVNVYNYLTKNSFYLLLSYNKIFKTKKKQKRKFSNIDIPNLKKLQLHRKYSIISSQGRNNVQIPFSNNRNISTMINPKFRGGVPAASLYYDIDSPIFRKLLSLLSNHCSSNNNKEVQLQIEQLLQNQALEIAKTKLSSQGESKNQNHIHKQIILKLAETKPRLEKIIKNYKSNLLLMDSHLFNLDSKIIYNMSTEFFINIMYGRLLNIISNNQLLNNKTYQVEVTIDLGKEIVNNYTTGIYKKIKQSNPNISYIQWKEENQEFIHQTNESQFLFELGNLLINFMIDLKLIKAEVKVLAKDDKKSILVVGPALVKLIPKLENSFSIQAIPNRIPMVCPPKIYKFKENKYLELGGYILNGEEYTDEIILSNWELSSKSTFLGENDIIKMVNKINSVAFKINEKVLDFILLNNHKYGFFTDIGDVNPLSFKQKLTMIEKRELASFNSRKHLELNILGLATIFREVPSIYLPVRIDYRGRIYCVTEYLNYQGIELAKGLLEFSIGEKVYLTDQDAINYLKIFGANCFGNKLDKKSFLDRVAWVDNNIENIKNFDNGILLNQAENKTLFLSFCFEYKKYVEALNNQSPYFVSKLPIQLDATCNGFQHLTLLIDDIALAKELNLNDASWNDIPKDFYTFIALKVKKYFMDKLEESHLGKLNLSGEDKESFKKLAELDIFRDLIKKAVMTIPYNASASSIIEYLKDSFDKQRVAPNLVGFELNHTEAQTDKKYKNDNI